MSPLFEDDILRECFESVVNVCFFEKDTSDIEAILWRKVYVDNKLIEGAWYNHLDREIHISDVLVEEGCSLNLAMLLISPIACHVYHQEYDLVHIFERTESWFRLMGSLSLLFASCVYYGKLGNLKDLYEEVKFREEIFLTENVSLKY